LQSHKQDIDCGATQGLFRSRNALGDLGNQLGPSTVLGQPSKPLKMAQTDSEMNFLPTGITLQSSSLAAPQEKVTQRDVIQQVTVRESTINASQFVVHTKGYLEGAASQSSKSETFLNQEISQVTQSFSRQRLGAIADIDAHDEKVSDFLVTEYVNEIMDYLGQRELAFLVPTNYLEGRKGINSRMRGVLLDWLVDVHFQYNFSAETLYLCQKLLDLYLMLDQKVTRTDLQLIGVSCLYVAAKFEEVFTPSMKDFASLCDNTFSTEQIKRTEYKIVNGLKFDILAPLPCTFLRRYSKAAKSDMKQHTVAKYFMELALLDYDLVDLKASESAAASLALAMMISKRGSLRHVWTPTLEYYSKYTVEALKPVVLRLANVIMRVHDEPKLQAVKNKYSKSKPNQRIARAHELSVVNWKDFVLADLEGTKIF